MIEFGVDVESHWQFLDLQVNKGRNHMTKLRIYMDLCKCGTSEELRLIDGFASLLREKWGPLALVRRMVKRKVQSVKTLL